MSWIFDMHASVIDESELCRSDEFAQQAASSIAAGPAEVAMYEAPPTGPTQHAEESMETASHDTMMAHHQTGKPGDVAAKTTPGFAEGETGPAGGDAQPGPSSRSVQQSALPDAAASPKSWCDAEKLLVACLMSGISCHAVLSPVLPAGTTE